MPIVNLVAEGVGPFDRLELDLSDGNGNPHFGPHILAGVKGSGKSTVMRTIGWLNDGTRGFQLRGMRIFKMPNAIRAQPSV